MGNFRIEMGGGAARKVNQRLSPRVRFRLCRHYFIRTNYILIVIENSELKPQPAIERQPVVQKRPERSTEPSGNTEQFRIFQYFFGQKLLVAVFAVECAEAGTGPAHLAGNINPARTSLDTRPAEQTLGKNILEDRRRSVSCHLIKQVFFAAAGVELLAAAGPENRADDGAGTAPGTALTLFSDTAPPSQDRVSRPTFSTTGRT